MTVGFKKIALKDACDVFTDGDWIERKDQSSEGIRLVQTGNIGFGYYKDKKDKARYISEETFTRLNCTEIVPGDLLVSRLPDPVGKSCIIPEINSKMITGVDCTIIRPKDNLSSEFLGYYQMSDQYLKDVQVNVGGATRQRISRKKLGLIEIPLPTLSQQKQIVGTLDKAFAVMNTAKANAEQNLQNAKELFESYLQNAFTNKSDDWEEKRFDEICVLQRGFDLPTRLRKEGVYPLVSSSGVSDFVDVWKVKSPGVSTGRSGTIGKVHFIEQNYFPLNTSLYIKDFHGNDERCIYYFLKQFDLSRFQSGAGVPTLNRNNVHSLKAYFPKLKDEQKQIVQKIDKISIEVKKLEAIYIKKIANLEEMKKSILQEAFKGELSM